MIPAALSIRFQQATKCPFGPSSVRLIATSILCLVLFVAGGARGEADRSIILATTTSVRDSGLLDSLLPDFTKESGIRVRVIAVGTGAALRMGREGNADVLLTHAPAAERELVDAGFVTRRTPFMENHFVIAGPPSDPARAKDAKDPTDAIRRIHAAQAPWVSRADDSGTHKKERALFAEAGLGDEGKWPSMIRTGSGMGLSLQVAGQRDAYILSDIGTFLAFRKRVGLEILSRPDPSLRNVYSILQLDASRFANPLHSAEARALEAFLLDAAVQERIGRFGRERYGRALFTPLAATREPAPRHGESGR